MCIRASMTRPGITKYPWLWCLVPGTDLAQEGPLLSLCDAHELCEGSLIDGWRGPDLLCNQLLYVPAMAINRHTLVCQSFQRAFPPDTKCFSFAHCGCSRKGFRCLAFWPRGTSGPTCRASQNLAATGRKLRAATTRHAAARPSAHSRAIPMAGSVRRVTTLGRKRLSAACSCGWLCRQNAATMTQLQQGGCWATSTAREAHSTSRLWAP